MSDNKKRQLERINKILVLIAKEYNNKPISVAELSQYFSGEDIPVLYGVLNDLERQPYVIKNKQKNNPLKLTAIPIFELEYEEITPYTILGVEKGEYSNEELLERVKTQINRKQFIKDRSRRKEEIDSILDAYNELAKTSSKKK